MSSFTSPSPSASAPIAALRPDAIKRGRPSKAAEERLYKVTTYVTAHRYAELRAEANVQRVRLSRLVRPLVETPAQPSRPATTKELLQLVRKLTQLAEDLRRLAERSEQEGFDRLAIEASFGIEELNRLLPNFKKLRW